MTKLYVCEISNLIKEVKADSNALENYFDKLGKQRIEHILKSNKAEDRARALGVSLLLLFALQKEGIRNEVLPDFAYKEEGKPYLEEYPYIHFSLSHTKNIITCVISDEEIGVDIEHKRDISETAIKRIFSDEEREIAEFSQEGYIRLWTAKEACAKLMGTGLSEIFDGLEICQTANGKMIRKLNQDIRKTFCYMIIAEGMILDSFDYPYYYSVCQNTDSTNEDSYFRVELIKYQWDNGKFMECN